MIAGLPLVDVHVHVPHPVNLKPGFAEWLAASGARAIPTDVVGDDGRISAGVMARRLDDEGVDLALLFCEYSPKVVGQQTVDDVLPVVEAFPDRFRMVGNVNPHLHHPIGREVARQIALGAVGLKVHPVHDGFSPSDRELYPAYERCQAAGVPVVVHTGTSVFPGASNRYADPGAMTDVIRDFPDLTVVLAHGGRGWWYDAAAFLALGWERVWIDIAGLPPRRIPHYYRAFDLDRLARRFVFGSDWPSVASIRANAEGIAALGLDQEVLEGVLSGNARHVYPIDRKPLDGTRE